MKCYMHVNFLEHLFSLEEIAVRCADAGYDGVEFRGRDTSGQLKLSDYLHRACTAARSAGLDVVLGCVSDAANSDAQIRSQALADLATTIRTAGEYGVTLLNVFGSNHRTPSVPYHHFDCHGSAIASNEDWTRTIDFFREAGKIAADCRVTLCFETHNVYLHDLGEPTSRLIRSIGSPNVKANFDWANMYLNRKNLGLDRELEMLASNIGYAHIKNVIAFSHYDSRLLRGTALSDGDINTYEFMRRLLATGFRGPLCIENIMPGDKRPLMKTDLAYLRSILAELA